MAKTYSGLFENIIQFDQLYSAYLSARKGKRKSWPCRHFEKNLEGELIQLQNDLIWGSYTTGPYKSFYVAEPKRRKITALTLFRDRVVQHAIFNQIEPLWESRFISDSYACRVGKGTHAGADKAQIMLKECLREHGKIYCLKADIRKYFASIDHETIKQLIRKRISDPRLLPVLENIIDSYHEEGRPGKGIPIGNLTSQLFANIYLDHFDQWVKCRKQVQRYVRYMDDFVVIHPDKNYLHALRLDAERFLQDELQLETNGKTSVFPVSHQSGRGLDFLGYHLWPDRRRLRKASLKRFKRRLRTCQRKYTAGTMNLSDVKQQLQSFIVHAKHGQASPAIIKSLQSSVFWRSK